MSSYDNKKQVFQELMEVVYELREKCPWDKKQTWQTLRPLTIEELYELTDAIADENSAEVKKEPGDVLLHILFYAMIAEEKQEFDIAEVCNSLKAKLIERHPHIYGEVKVNDAEDVKRNWEQIKLKSGSKTILSGVPKSLPSLVKAGRLQEKAAAVGFDWADKKDVWDKVKEEMQEFADETSHENPDINKIEEEFGDLLFSLVNYARFLDINPDNALEKTNQKFIKRFNYLENEVNQSGKKLQDLTLAEMDVYWNEAKKKERKPASE
ncbi:MAG: nucleoside triphosphate pyrophosphohydrolase [Sphingobacteriales bacterium]|nr:MAG: nucleoside triphosphate pyrophosphohydrolase [Sphingobacteriales bacterium]